jgi:putative ABC transport system substrate-binding protein
MSSYVSCAHKHDIRELSAERLLAIRNLGYVEGQTIALDFRLSKGIMDALPALAAELVRVPVNIIVTDSTSATLAAFAATRTIPIVRAPF